MTEQLEQLNRSARAANSNHISNYMLKPYFVMQLIWTVFESILQLENKITTFNLHRLTIWRHHCKDKIQNCIRHIRGKEKKVITNLVSLWLNLCIFVQCAGQLAITQHHGELIYLSRLPALLNPAIAWTCNFSNSLFSGGRSSKLWMPRPFLDVIYAFTMITAPASLPAFCVNNMNKWVSSKLTLYGDILWNTLCSAGLSFAHR